MLILIPNIVYCYKNKSVKNKYTNRLMNILEQVGRYSSMFLMIFNVGIVEFAFKSANGFSIWLISISVLILFYWIFWFFYLKAPKIYFAMLLAIIPSAIFMFSGFILRHWLLVIFAVIFSIAHIYITYQNNRVK